VTVERIRPQTDQLRTRSWGRGYSAGSAVAPNAAYQASRLRTDVGVFLGVLESSASASTYGLPVNARSDSLRRLFGKIHVLKELSGDILLTEAQVIAHGVAPSDDFAQGLALKLREQYPAMAKDFRHYCHIEHPRPGDVWAWAGTGGTRVVNLMTQEAAPNKGANPGKASTHNVNAALRNFRQLIEREGFTSVALPRLATGVGGLDWRDVRPLILNHLGDLDIPVYVYATYHAGQKGDE
jgi:O-acetyl-ADP-ribose deacetylase (regulator of RNase III)